MLRTIAIAVTIINLFLSLAISKELYYEEPIYWDVEPPKYIYQKPTLQNKDDLLPDINPFYHVKFDKRNPNNIETEFDNDQFLRPTRQDKNDNFVRFGRGNSDFVRFGRNPYANQNFLRFGRSTQSKRNKREALSNYEEDKRSERDNFLRFGRTSDDSFVRYGRNRLNNDNTEEQTQTKNHPSYNNNLTHEKTVNKPLKMYDKLLKIVPLLSILQKLKEISQNDKDCCNQ